MKEIQDQYASGAGAFWNVLDVGQMLRWHVMLLPLVIGVLIGLHILLVRLRGVVPPIGVAPDGSLEPERKGGAR